MSCAGNGALRRPAGPEDTEMHVITQRQAATVAPMPRRRADGIAGLFRDAPVPRHVQPGGTIFLHGERAQSVYLVVSGTVRCCTITQDGRRQIFRFARCGDLLGYVDAEVTHFTAEAVDHVILKAIPRAVFEHALADSPSLQRELRDLISAEIEVRERQLCALVHLQAVERLWWFLSGFAASRRTDGFVALPMTRQDIGDHLGLTLETVSRGFSALRRSGRLEMRGTDRFHLLGDRRLAA